MAATHRAPDPPLTAERRKWIRFPCHPRGTGGHLVAYLPGSLLAEVVRDISAGGLSLVLGHRLEPENLTVELYNLRSRFRLMLAARVVSVVEHSAGCFLVGAAFRWKLTVEELRRLL